MSAWITREWKVGGRTRREKSGPTMKGVKKSDRFVVEWIDPHGKRCRKKVAGTGRPAKRLADDLARQITAKLTLGTYDKTPRKKWTEFQDDYQLKIVSKKRPSTQRMVKETLNLFGEICRPAYVDAITTQTIDTFRHKLSQRRGRKRGSKMSPFTVNRHLRHLKAALRKAHVWKSLRELPVFEFLDEPEILPVYMRPDHFDLIYKSCEQATEPSGRDYPAAHWWQALMVIGIMGGLRIQEMLSLPWDDLHLDERYLIVRNQNAKGNRDDLVPLHPAAVDHLRRVTEYSARVFDWPLRRELLWDAWEKIQLRAGIHLLCRGDHEHTARCHVYGFHSLKKACGTLNASRLTKPVLNAFMRHRASATTEKFYLNQEKLVEGVTDAMYVPAILRTES
jgi:integrase